MIASDYGKYETHCTGDPPEKYVLGLAGTNEAWFVPAISLAYLGWLWHITPEILFPSSGTWSDDPENGLELQRGWDTSNLVEIIDLPSLSRFPAKRVSRSSPLIYGLGRVAGTIMPPIPMDQDITGTLFLATTFWRHTKQKSLYRRYLQQPFYVSLRLIRVSRVDRGNRVENFIILTDFAPLRDFLKDHLKKTDGGLSGSCPGMTDDKGSVLLVRSIRRFILCCLCNSLNEYKIRLEESVRSFKTTESLSILMLI